MTHPKTSQLSRFVYSGMTTDPVLQRLSEPYQLQKTMNLFMLTQDLHAFPYRDDRVNVSVESSPTRPDWEKTVAKAVAHSSRYGGERYRRGLDEALRDLAEFCVPHVLLFGEAAYEIVYSNPDKDGRWQSFFLARVHPYQRRLGRHRHYKAAVGDQSGEWVTLPDDRVVVFRLEPKKQRAMVRAAIQVLASSSPGVLLRGDLIGKPGYDVSTAIRAERALMAKATRDLGWNGRSMYHEYSSAPYETLRNLKFALFESQMREMIVEGVQQALDKVAVVLGVQSQIHVECHPTLSEIQAAIHDLEVGPGRDKSLWQLERPIIL